MTGAGCHGIIIGPHNMDHQPINIISNVQIGKDYILQDWGEENI